MRACARPLEAPVVAGLGKVDVVNVVFANHIAGAEEPYAIRVCAGSRGRPWRVLNRMADIIAFNQVIDSLHHDPRHAGAHNAVARNKIILG